MWRIIKSVWYYHHNGDNEKMQSVDGDIEQLELSHSAGGSADWCHHFVILFVMTF